MPIVGFNHRLADALREDPQEHEMQPQEDETTYHDWEDDVIEYDQQEEY